jgi:hypothetical protein
MIGRKTIRNLALSVLLSMLALSAQPVPAAGNSASADTSPTAQDTQQRLETEKLRLETESLQRQSQKEWIEHLKDLGSLIQSLATAIALLVGGLWVYTKFVRAQEKYPNIEFSADINVIGEQGGSLIVELIAYVENKGKAQHRMNEFKFDLNALLPQDPVLADQRWTGQTNFPHEVAVGSFLPARNESFFVDPGTKAKYSYIACVPREVTFLMLHCRFNYSNRGKTMHAAERTIKVVT